MSNNRNQTVFTTRNVSIALMLVLVLASGVIYAGNCLDGSCFPDIGTTTVPSGDIKAEATLNYCSLIRSFLIDRRETKLDPHFAKFCSEGVPGFFRVVNGCRPSSNDFSALLSTDGYRLTPAFEALCSQ